MPVWAGETVPSAVPVADLPVPAAPMGVSPPPGPWPEVAWPNAVRAAGRRERNSDVSDAKDLAAKKCKN
ncbi:hypothetical protein GCM10018782_37110 [Streptomyces griseoaurantiacus]|nr:hypothetical protein GCM10018782_37110 [Streptomyces griseoaurantiacus]